jgi:hypothetical protein
MKVRLLFASLVLLVLAGTLYWSERRKPTDENKVSADAPPAILKLDETTVTRLELKKKNTEPIVLEKSNSGEWQITQPQAFNADSTAVSAALSTLSSLNSERLVEQAVSNPQQFGLAEPALEVGVTEKDNKTQTLLIGDATPTGNAVYAELRGDPRVFTIASYTKNGFDKSLNDLRDKRLITISADKISRLELIRKNEEIEFGRDKEKEEWQILKPKPLRADNAQVAELITKLADARMDLSESDKDLKGTAADFAHATPVVTATVTDQSGTQELQIRKSSSKGGASKDNDKDTYYAKTSAVAGVYKVDSTLAQACDKPLDDFRNKKLFDFGFQEPGKIELHNGSKAYFFTRTGQDWWSNGKKVDAGSAENLISNLRGMAASKFIDSGFTNPTLEIAVTSEDGKRVDKVSIAKSGNEYIARRENDPTLYQLDSSTVDGIVKAADEIKPVAPSGK